MRRTLFRRGLLGAAYTLALAAVAVGQEGPVPVSDLSSHAVAMEQPSDVDAWGLTSVRPPLFDWYAAVEGTYLSVSNLGPTSINMAGQDGSVTSGIFRSDYGVGPRTWFGVESSSGWGLRARFWDFKDAQTRLVSEVWPTSVGAAAYAFHAYTVDLELTKKINIGQSSLEGALGARHASLERDESIVANHVLQPIFAVSPPALMTAATTRRLDAMGFTGFLEGRREIGDSGWTVFANTRGSVLWGRNAATAAISYVDSAGITGIPVSAAGAAGNDTLFIAEMQAGVEWSYALTAIRSTLFARGAFELQEWSADGTAANHTASINKVGVGNSVQASAPNPYASLIGLAFAVGISR